MKIVARSGSAVSSVKTARFISLFQMYLFGAGIVLIAAFLFAQTAKAQEAATPESPVPAAEPAPGEAEPAPGEVVAPEPVPVPTPAPVEPAPVEATDDAAADEVVTHEDLGVKEADVLPDNPLYGVKRFGRGLRKAFTFNKAKKIKLEIKYANQELVDAQRLVEEKGDDPESYEKVAEAVDRMEDALSTVKERASEIASAGDEAQAGEVVQEVLDNQIKQQKFLEHIEQQVADKAPEAIAAQVVERIQNASDQASAHAGETVGQLEQDPDRLRERFDQALQNQRGSDFKDLRNLEVLKRLEDHVPDAAKDAIRQAEGNTLKRFADNFQQLPEERRLDRFENYVQNVGGDQTRHLEIFDRMKGLENLPPEIAKKMELAKDIVAQRFKEEVEKIDKDFGDVAIQERMRARVFARFDQSGGPDVKKLRVLEDIRQRVQFENETVKQEFEAKHEEGITVFKATFTDTTSQDQVARFAELSKKMAENPDPTTFRPLAKLEEEVKADPEKRKFIERMQQEAKAQFVEQASKRGGEFFERIASSNPQDIEIFQKLKEDFQKDPSKFAAPPAFGPGGFPLPPGIGPEGFGPPPFGGEGFGPPGFGPEGFGPPPFVGGPPPGFAKFFDQAIQTHTQALGEHVQSLKNPELFQNFQKKFFNGPPDIAREIEAQFQGNFSQIFQDQRRMIQDQSFNQAVGGEERLRLEEERARVDADFQARLQSAATPEEQSALEAEHQQKNQEFQNRSTDLRRQQFEQQIQFDPFCDEACRRGEAKNFEQTLRTREDSIRGIEDQFRQQFQEISQQFGGQFPPGGFPGGGRGCFPGQGFPQGPPPFGGAGQPFGPGGQFAPPGQGPSGFGPQGQPFGPGGQFQPPGFGSPRGEAGQQQLPAEAFDPGTGALIPDHLRKDVLQREAKKRGLEVDTRGQLVPPKPPESQSAEAVNAIGQALPDHLRPDVLKREVEKQRAADLPAQAEQGRELEGVRPDVIQRDVTQKIIQDQINNEILRQGGTMPGQPGQSGSNFGQPPVSGGFQSPPPSGGGSTFFPPPSGDGGGGGSFAPPSGGFAPQGLLNNDSPTSKVINILASFFGLDRVFGAIGL